MSMRDFKPAMPYTVAAELLIPTISTVKGVTKKTFPENGVGINCSFKTFGGTESVENGVYSVVDTATIETWYRPDIKADCRIKILSTGSVYEIVGKPENIDMRNQFLSMRVRGVEGGA